MKSDLLTYLDNYQHDTFDRMPFNEVDALLFSSLAYPKYHEIIGDMENCDSQTLLELIDKYDDSSLTERKKLNIKLLRKVFSIPRFNGIRVFHYRHSVNKDISEQFQAVSFLFSDYVIVSFCGTDNTVVGLKEDLDMSYLAVTPSEIDAMNYLEEINAICPGKQLILVGHSKGGRLALSSAKNYFHKENIRDIYTFDSPNYQDEFYDKDYQSLESKVHNYLPEESIIGRLINEPRKPIIVQSYNSLIQQHDITSWIIKDNHFLISITGFSKQSTRIVNALNHNLEQYSHGTKKEFADTLYGLIDRLEIHEFNTKDENVSLLKRAIKHVPHEWRNTPKKDRLLLRKIIFDLLKSYIFGTNKDEEK